MQIVLASSSPYRQILLKRLGLEFECCSPNIDESLDETLDLASNVCAIALKKAQAIMPQYKQALLIASDQLCSLNGKVLGKPHDHERAFEQLREASGQTVNFYTGLIVYDLEKQKYCSHCDITSVVFRSLADEEIHRYLHHEQPYDCAGSFKVESLGISLFEKVINDDPTALIGLPLIKLCAFLRQYGVVI